MTHRISKRLVTFQYPFNLDSIERQWPAGDYTIETEEEPLNSNSFLAYRTVSTTMILHSGKGRPSKHVFVEIEASELESALLRDHERSADHETKGITA